MTEEWSLARLLAGLHEDIQHGLALSRQSFGHPGVKGDASESVWLKLFNYLPQRYQAATAHVVDSKGKFSDQIDVVVFDRQYSPFIFEFEGKKIVPAESVYAVFEAKQTINKGLIEYAQEKVASVRALHRTSLPIPHAGGTYPPKPPIYVLGGILSFESEWNPALGESLIKALETSGHESRLDLGCIASHGIFSYQNAEKSYQIIPENRPATSFLFELISRLQSSATVPMIDIKAYAAWLAPEIDLQ
jgi:hypothetical protein